MLPFLIISMAIWTMKCKISSLWRFIITGLHRTSTAAWVIHQDTAKRAARQGYCESQHGMSISPPPALPPKPFMLWAMLFPLASSRFIQKPSCMCCKYVCKQFEQTEISLWINCLLQLSIYENSCPQLEKCGRIPPQINPLFAFC